MQWSGLYNHQYQHGMFYNYHKTYAHVPFLEWPQFLMIVLLDNERYHGITLIGSNIN